MINLNPPRWVRAWLYLAGAIGTLLLQWATDEHWLDAPTRTLVAGVIALVLLVATGNTVRADQSEPLKKIGRRVKVTREQIGR